MSCGFVHRPVAALATGVLLMLSGVAIAQEPTVASGERSGRNSGDRSLSDAVRHVQRTTGGRILGAERVPYDGRDINRVKYMDDRGRVRYMDAPVPPRSAPPETPRHRDHP